MAGKRCEKTEFEKKKNLNKYQYQFNVILFRIFLCRLIILILRIYIVCWFL